MKLFNFFVGVPLLLTSDKLLDPITVIGLVAFIMWITLNSLLYGAQPPRINWLKARYEEVNSVLRVFFICRMLLQLGLMTLAETENSSTPAEILWQLLIDSCETPLAVAGIISAVVLATAHLTRMSERFMRCPNAVWSTSMKQYSTVVFALYASTSMLASASSTEERLPLLCWDVVMMAMFVLLRLPDMLEEAVLLVPAAEVPNRIRSTFGRAAILSAPVFLVPLVMVMKLPADSVPSGWMVILTALTIQTFFKLLRIWGVYTIYVLHELRFLDANLGWYVIGLQTVCHFAEFIVSIYIVIAYMHHAIFVSMIPVYSTKGILHLYWDIWPKAVEGYGILSRMYAEMRIIDFLPDASEQELLALNDVCPICHLAMLKAKRTKCGHFFHQRCLNESYSWSQLCPKCRRPI